MNEWHEVPNETCPTWAKKNGKFIIQIQQDTDGFCVSDVTNGQSLLGCRTNLGGAKELGDAYLKGMKEYVCLV